MKKSVIITTVILLVLLVIFLFPKNAGFTCGFCGPHPSVHRTEHDCIGWKYDIQPEEGCADCGILIRCIGIPTSEKTCYSYSPFESTDIVNCE